MRLLILLLTLLAACAPKAPMTTIGVSYEPAQAPVAAVVEQPTENLTCSPCESSCLDTAEQVQDAHPEQAMELASEVCDLEVCGYVGTADLLRCKSFGFLQEVPIVGPGM